MLTHPGIFTACYTALDMVLFSKNTGAKAVVDKIVVADHAAPKTRSTHELMMRIDLCGNTADFFSQILQDFSVRGNDHGAAALFIAAHGTGGLCHKAIAAESDHFGLRPDDIGGFSPLIAGNQDQIRLLGCQIFDLFMKIDIIAGQKAKSNAIKIANASPIAPHHPQRDFRGWQVDLIIDKGHTALFIK